MPKIGTPIRGLRRRFGYPLPRFTSVGGGGAASPLNLKDRAGLTITDRAGATIQSRV